MFKEEQSLFLMPGTPTKARTIFVPDSFVEFDSVLGKACSICQKNDLDGE